MNGDIFVPIFLFGGIAAVMWKYFDVRHRERMSMIEKGLNPADFKGPSFREYWRINPLSSLKWGLIALFVGGGLFFAGLFERSFNMHDSIYPASMLVSGGVALIIFYAIASSRLKKDQS